MWLYKNLLNYFDASGHCLPEWPQELDGLHKLEPIHILQQTEYGLTLGQDLTGVSVDRWHLAILHLQQGMGDLLPHRRHL